MDREELENEIDDLRDRINDLKHENATLTLALKRPWDEKSSLHKIQARAEIAEQACERMRDAIKRALADAESGNGWGPDVTVCEYLRAALGTPNVEITCDRQPQAVRRQRNRGTNNVAFQETGAG